MSNESDKPLEDQEQRRSRQDETAEQRGRKTPSWLPPPPTTSDSQARRSGFSPIPLNRDKNQQQKPPFKPVAQPPKDPISKAEETQRQRRHHGDRPAPLSASVSRNRDAADTKHGTRPDREDRIICSFPGVLKVLIPEESFVPFPVAVRVCNLSSGGALVEAHDAVKINPDRLLTNRYFELKVAHVDIPDLRGKIAWTDFSQKNPRLGVSCFDRVPELENIVKNSESAIQWEGPPPLPTPTIDPFPPTTRESKVVISGKAPEALEVVVKREKEKFVADVRQGIFRVILDMVPEAENQFLLRTVAGERRSRAVPIHIVYERGVRSRKFYFDVTMDKDKESGTSTIDLDFQGSVRQAERVLYRFSQLMTNSERVVFKAELSTQSAFDRRLFETLKAEGAVLAADSTQNQAAAKLLDELL